MRVPYNYLPKQFADYDSIIDDWKKLISTSEFTLGLFVEEFERKFAAYVGIKHCVSTNTGTDALILALKAARVQPGDEVITVTNTFYATVGAIVATGAKPVLVDCDDRYQIDVEQIESAISDKTKAIIPVHWGGCSPDMAEILKISETNSIPAIEDACPAVGAYIKNKHAGTFGLVNAFSMHPLKPLNVMGDGGMVVTDDEELAIWMKKYRNHGMIDRDHIEMWGVNMRLQPLQAIVASHILDTVKDLVKIRNRNARLLDSGLSELSEFVELPGRPKENIEAYQLYMACFDRRDELIKFLIDNGIEAKIHYPIPLHLQPPGRKLGYKIGDFPNAENQAKRLITLPSHQFIDEEQIEYMIQTIKEFYTS